MFRPGENEGNLKPPLLFSPPPRSHPRKKKNVGIFLLLKQLVYYGFRTATNFYYVNWIYSLEL